MPDKELEFESINYTIKDLCPDDIPYTINIELEHTSDTLTYKDMVTLLSTPGYYGYCIYLKGFLVGYMLCSIYDNRVEILQMTISIVHRRRKAGSMLAYFVEKVLCNEHRKEICVLVSEHNTPAQLFLKSNGYTLDMKDRIVCGEDEEVWLFTKQADPKNYKIIKSFKSSPNIKSVSVAAESVSIDPKSA